LDKLRHDDLKNIRRKAILIPMGMKCGIPWRSMEESGLGLAISEKTYIQNVIPKFEGHFGKEFKSIKTHMSEGYYPEIYDSPLCIEDDSAKYRSIVD
jgi:hypothetical protein